MTMCKRSIASLLALVVLIGTAPGAWAANAPPAPPAPPAAGPAPAPPGTPSAGAPTDAALPTPARLSYTDGDVSFWRPGGDDWAPAQVNTPLAPGDQLYTGHAGNLEIQVDARAFVRAWGDSQLGIENHEPDYLQVKVTAGHVSLDLRTLDPGHTVELDTPAAAFTIERAGYYRVDVAPDRTTFVTRRGGTATMTPSGGQAVAIAASEQVVVGAGSTPVQTFVAPELDVWDRWNYARTEALIDTVSARYAPAGIAGIDDLDQHGTWRVVPEYGSVWIPDGVAPDWAPYTTGRWMWDPRFGWSWVDVAPWGWAPYHYGRWVYVNSVWAWAPGPIVVHPAYAPALVAFFGPSGVRVAVGAPFVSWVALGWGEPCVPWWGRAGFIGRPWWGGWGGPHVVNNVVVNRTTVVNVTNITTYRNVNVRNAVVAVRPDGFGRGPVADARIRQVDTRQLEPVRGAIDLRPDRASFAAASGRAVRPPDTVMTRPVVATRAPASRALPHEPEGRGPAPRLVPAPRPGEGGQVTARPPFGQSGPERARPPRAPRFGADRGPDVGAPPAPRRGEPVAPPAGRSQPSAPRPQAPGPAEAPRPPAPAQPIPAPAHPPGVQRAPAAPPHATERPASPAPGRPEAPRPQPRPLPGEPANRLYPGGRVEGPAPGAAPGRPMAHPGPAQEQRNAREDRPAREPR